ncbi:TPA: hypothetical protein ACH1TP_004360 [Enterobacter roggenkampii]|uniref:hypothetical protein n=1 Tax=Enterobacter cloacae complex TaxID=354276 RepID=UPI0003BE69C8|nr:MULTISPECIES: hypothetical protein [Enterobacter cloacae complex]ESN54770.1 hypothetical protein L362_01685 [Enterobacter sp. MGH 16]MBW4220196.1 hypothetical protein [Enterobacter roggenkampii]
MAINYQRMQATAIRMLKQNGIAYNVTRKGSLIVIGGVEHRSEDIQFTAIGVKTDYAPGEIDGTVIENGDVRIVFSAEKDIKTGDLIDVDGVSHRVVKPNPVKPGAVVLCYKSQLRA